MCRLMEMTVRSGLVMACRLATWPTSRSPSLENATTEGVVREPSALGMTTGSPPSITATTELVVPRSIPITLLILLFSSLLAAAPGHFHDAGPERPSAKSVSFDDLFHHNPVGVGVRLLVRHRLVQVGIEGRTYGGDGDDADPFQDREKLLVNHLYAFDHAAGRPGFGGLDGPLQVVDDGEEPHHQLLGALGLALLQLAAGPLAIVVKLRLQPEQPVVKLLPLRWAASLAACSSASARLELGDGRLPLAPASAASRRRPGRRRLPPAFRLPRGLGAVAASAGRAALAPGP